ncbi:tetratricopeptide (TPR) repeat protein [Streptomyces zagrosensis]|uniref:Tetratricopeptide (TPR) repeat protein n=1 Tax=Streptomyces zagrosensis TaxID=1042984 RepID=A0A7W9QFK4_9ACTN|nr:tetratricopeptide (TPR) repeat protein [Streptomyces zagrosensis]
MPPSEPNGKFERLYQETGWTLRQLAQDVNRIATEAGSPTKYQAQSTYQWCNGHIPARAVRPLILESLSRKLGRVVSHAEAGFPTPPAGASITGQGDIVAELISLGRLDMDASRRTLLSAGIFSATLTVPSWTEAIERKDLVTLDSSARVGASDVSFIRTMIKHFAKLDNSVGGKAARPSAATFLVNDVIPLLRAPARESVRADLLAAISEFCYLLGLMAVDEGAHRLAQRYYSKSLELAGGAGDPSLYSLTLRGMASQAVNAGHGPTALRLANAAADVTQRVSPNMRVHLLTQRAHSAAAAGHRSEAISLLHQAEKTLSKAEPETSKSTVPLAEQGLLDYFRAKVEYSLGDVSGSVTAMHEALEPLKGQGCVRRRILDTSWLAERQLQTGMLEEACATWSTALAEYPQVRSGRCDEQMRIMFSRLRPYLRNASAHSLYEQARNVVPAHLVAK